MSERTWFEYRVIRGKKEELTVPDGWERVYQRWYDGRPAEEIRGTGSFMSDDFYYIIVRREKHWPWYLRWMPCAHEWEKIRNESDREYPPMKFLCVKCGCTQERHTPQSLEPWRDW